MSKSELPTHFDGYRLEPFCTQLAALVERFHVRDQAPGHGLGLEELLSNANKRCHTVAFDQFPALVCKNCSRPIPLPPAKHPDTLEGEGLWPEGGSRRNFLCPACRHVHGYSAQDVQLMLPHTDPRRAGTSYNVVYIRLQCGVEGCASTLRIRTLMAIHQDPHKEAPVILASSYAHAIACGNGHILWGPIAPYGLALDADCDEDWEIGEGWNRRAQFCA